MMGRAKPVQGKLFYDGFRLDERVRKDHPLRTIRKLVDFTFAYREVNDRYGYNGNVSVPPPVILKLMFLLFYYDVASERELLETLPERLDWLWFLDYDLDTLLPDHSVLSKARARWGGSVFWRLFERTVEQCVAMGLVDGHDVCCDSSLVDANAANDSIRRAGRYVVLCGNLAQRLSDVSEQGEDGDKEEGKSEKEHKGQAEAEDKSKGDAEDKTEDRGKTDAESEGRWLSMTDRDAAVVAGRGGSRARYKTHRMIDGRHGVVTATEITAGDVNEAHRLASLLDRHEAVTGLKVQTVAADSKYGTIDNYLHCIDRNVVAHMPDMKQATRTSGRKRGMFPDTEFRYCPEEDAYICPAGERLKQKHFNRARQSHEYYGSKGMCGKCRLREQCTTSKRGRSIKRHLRQDDIDGMRREAGSWRAVVALKRRQHLMEGSFADGANNHGLKRARWRGLRRVAIQDYLIAAVQNIRTMVKNRLRRAGVEGQVKARPETNRMKAILTLFQAFSDWTGWRLSPGLAHVAFEE